VNLRRCSWREWRVWVPPCVVCRRWCRVSEWQDRSTSPATYALHDFTNHDTNTPLRNW